MFRMIFSALICALLFSGCLADVLMTTAIRGEAEAQQLQAMQRQIGHAKDTAGETNLRHAIQLYQAEKGANPPSLEALVPKYLASIPPHADGTPYGYDAATGQLLDGPAATTGPTAQDYETMNAIRAAINRYGTEVGYYPPTLDALSPRFIPVPPRTSSGAQFVYDNKNGFVGHPQQAASAPRPAAAAAPRRGGGVSGGGLMGETMTGIGVQNQLNSMGNSGVNSAGTRSRGNVRGLQTQQNQNVNQTMNNLGL